jgi:hypothetical protein
MGSTREKPILRAASVKVSTTNHLYGLRYFSRIFIMRAISEKNGYKLHGSGCWLRLIGCRLEGRKSKRGEFVLPG